MHILLLILGLTNAAGPWYLFWSGFYAVLSAGIAIFLILRKFNCHWEKCPRIAWQPHPNGTGVMLCRKHLPEAKEAWRERRMTHSRIRGISYNARCSHGHRKNPTAVSKVSQAGVEPASIRLEGGSVSILALGQVVPRSGVKPNGLD